jgi:hypothetical protein
MELNPEMLVGNAFNILVNVGIFVSVIVVGLLAGYLIGSVIAAIVRRIMGIRELKEQIASSEILSLNLWGRISTGVGVYVKWLFVAMGLKSMVSWALHEGVGSISMFQILVEYIQGFQDLMLNIGVFLIFSVVGVIIGAVVYRIIKGVLDSIRVEEKIAKHGLHNALGGMQLTKVIAGIFMVYVMLVLIGSGIDTVAANSGPAFSEVRLVVMFRSLVNLYPEFVLGGFILIAGMLVGDFIESRVKKSKAAISSDSVGWILKAMVIFFAVVLALPHFQIKDNVHILTDSFKIIIAGISIGVAIAMGLGLKDCFAHWGKKIEKGI